MNYFFTSFPYPCVCMKFYIVYLPVWFLFHFPRCRYKYFCRHLQRVYLPFRNHCICCPWKSKKQIACLFIWPWCAIRLHLFYDRSHSSSDIWYILHSSERINSGGRSNLFIQFVFAYTEVHLNIGSEVSSAVLCRYRSLEDATPARCR